MSLTQADRNRLKRIIQLAEDLLASDVTDGRKRSTAGREGGRIRRSGKELTAFRKMLVAERKKGVAVAELARKHGITTAYIYQLK